MSKFAVLAPTVQGLELQQFSTRGGQLFLIVPRGAPVHLDVELLDFVPKILFAKLARRFSSFAAAIITPKIVFTRSDPHGGLCWYRSKDRPDLFSVEIESLDNRGNINKEYLANFLCATTLNRPQSRSTAWHNIERLPPGITWIISDGSIRKVREVEPKSPTSPAKAAELLQEHFSQIMPTGKNGMLLSGGSDSSLLLNFAASQGHHFEALHFTHSSHALGSDTSVARSVCAKWESQVSLTQIELNSPLYYKNMVSNALFFAEPSIGIYFSEHHLRQDSFFIERNINIIITGEAGDAFHGNLEYLNAMYRHKNWFSLLQELWKLTQIGNITRSDYILSNKIVHKWFLLKQKAPKSLLKRVHSYLRTDAFEDLTSASPILEAQRALSYHQGLSYHHPFLGETPLALALNLKPKDLLTQKDGNRAFYREHLRHLLPSELHKSVPLSHWSGIEITGFKNHFEEIRILLKDSQLAKLGWINPTLFLENLESSIEKNISIEQLEKRVLVTEAWLQAHQGTS